MTDEEQVVDMVRQRVAHGRKLYGPLNLNTDKRDLVQEALEEALDLAVYCSSRLIQLQRITKLK